MKKRAKNRKKDGDFLSAKEYETLVRVFRPITSYWQMLTAAGILGLFLEEHDGEYEKSYEGKT